MQQNQFHKTLISSLSANFLLKHFYNEDTHLTILKFTRQVSYLH